MSLLLAGLTGSAGHAVPGDTGVLAKHAVAAGGAVLADGDTGKGSPIGLFVVLLLVVAVYFLYRSLSRHIRNLPESFDGSAESNPATVPNPAQSTVPNPTQATVPGPGQTTVPNPAQATVPKQATDAEPTDRATGRPGPDQRD